MDATTNRRVTWESSVSSRDNALTLLKDKDNRIARLKEELRVEKEINQRLSQNLNDCATVGQRLADLVKEGGKGRGELPFQYDLYSLHGVILAGVSELEKTSEQLAICKKHLAASQDPMTLVESAGVRPKKYKISGKISTVVDLSDCHGTFFDVASSEVNLLRKNFAKLEKRVKSREAIFLNLKENSKRNKKLLWKRLFQVKEERAEYSRMLKSVLAMIGKPTESHSHDNIDVESVESYVSSYNDSCSMLSISHSETREYFVNSDMLNILVAIVDKLNAFSFELEIESQGQEGQLKLNGTIPKMRKQIHKLYEWKNLITQLSSIRLANTKLDDEVETSGRCKGNTDETIEDSKGNLSEVFSVEDENCFSLEAMMEEKRRLEHLLDIMHDKLTKLKEKLEKPMLSSNPKKNENRELIREQVVGFDNTKRKHWKSTNEKVENKLICDNSKTSDIKNLEKFESLHEERTKSHIPLATEPEKCKPLVDRADSVENEKKVFQDTIRHLTSNLDELDPGLHDTDEIRNLSDETSQPDEVRFLVNRVDDLEISLHKSQIELERYQALLHQRNEVCQEMEDKIQELEQSNNSLQSEIENLLNYKLERYNDHSQREEKSTFLKQEHPTLNYEKKSIAGILNAKDKQIFEYESVIDDLRAQLKECGECVSSKHSCDIEIIQGLQAKLKEQSKELMHLKLVEDKSEQFYVETRLWQANFCSDLDILKNELEEKNESRKKLLCDYYVLKQKLEIAVQENLTLKTDLDNQSVKFGKLKDDYSALIKETTNLESKIDGLDKENSNLVQELEITRKEVSSVKISLKESHLKSDDINSLLTKLKEKETLTRKLLADEKDKREHLQTENKLLRKNLLEVKTSTESLQYLVINCKEEKDFMSEKLSNLADHEQELQKSLAQEKEKCAELQNSHDTMKKEIQNATALLHEEHTEALQNIVVLQTQLGRCQQEREILRIELEKIKKENINKEEVLTQKQTTLEDELRDLRAENQKFVTELLLYEKKITALQTDREKCEQKIKISEEEIKRLGTVILENHIRIGDLTTAEEKLKSDLSRTSEEILSLKDRERVLNEALHLSNTEIMNWQSLYKDCDSSNRLLQGEVERLNGEKNKIETAIQQMSEQKTTMDRSLTEQQEKDNCVAASRLQLEMDFQETCEKLQESISHCNSLQKRMEELSTDVINKSMAVDSLTVSLQQCETESQIWKQKCKELELIVERHHIFLEKERDLPTKDIELQDLSMKNKLKQNETHALDKTLYARREVLKKIHYCVSLSVCDLKSQLTAIKEFTIAESNKLLKDVQEEITSYVTVSNRTSASTALTINSLPRTTRNTIDNNDLKTKDAELWALYKKIEQIDNACSAREDEILDKDKQIKNLKEELHRKEKYFEEVLSELDSLRGQKNPEEEQIQTLVETLQATLETLKSELVTMKQENESLKTQVEITRNEMERLHFDCTESKRILDNLRHQLQGSVYDETDSGPPAHDLQTICKELCVVVKDILGKKPMPDTFKSRTEYTTTATSPHESNAKFDVEQIELLEREVERLHEKMKTNKKSLKESRQKDLETRYQLAELEKKLAIAESEKENFRLQITSMRNEKKDVESSQESVLKRMQDQLYEKDAMLYNLHGEVGKLREIIEKEKLLSKEKLKNLEEAKTRLTNELDRTSKLVRSYKTEIEDMQDKLSHYRNKIRDERVTIEEKCDKSKSKQVAVIKRELSEAVKEKYAYMTKVQELTGALDIAQEKITNLREDLSKSQEGLKVSKKDLVLAQTELQWLQSALKTAKVNRLNHEKNTS